MEDSGYRSALARWVGLSCMVALLGCGSHAEEPRCPQTTSGAETTAPTTTAAPTTTIDQDIREVLVLTNAIGTAKQMAAPLLAALARAYPAVPASAWSELMRSAGTEDFTALLVEIYKRNYTREEIGAMLHFYRSDIARIIIKKIPAVLAESQQVGAAWGQRITARLLEAARSRGYEL